MTQSAHDSAALGDYGEIIRALHEKDQRNQAVRTRRAIILGVLLVVLGGASLTGRASGGPDSPIETATSSYFLSDHRG